MVVMLRETVRFVAYLLEQAQDQELVGLIGGNIFHGSLFEYLRNDKLDARNFFDRTKAPLRMNQFGGSVGGPIVKDRVFFFGSYEGYRLRNAVNIIEAVPSAFAKSQAVPAVASIIDAFKDPRAAIIPGGSTDPNFDIARLVANNTVDENAFGARLDFKLNTNHSIYTRFFRDQGFNIQPQSVSGRQLQIRTFPQNGVIAFQSILGAKMVNVPMIYKDNSLHFDPDGILNAITDRTKIICIANPNNPTGNFMAPEHFIRIAETGIPFVIDEAYVEYAGLQMSQVQLTKKYKNVFITRTLSKAYGLAGMRFGYTIADKTVIDRIAGSLLPWNVGTIPMWAALAAFDDPEGLAERIKFNNDAVDFTGGDGSTTGAASTYAPNGTFVSEPIDAGLSAKLDGIQWNAAVENAAQRAGVTQAVS
jgi:hypothetical protein